MRVLISAMAIGFVAPVAVAQHGSQQAPPQGETHSLQGDQSAWINNPHMHAFFDLTKAKLGGFRRCRSFIIKLVVSQA